ncbi:MAG: PQQ-dependent sugar dehydrogenase [Verrucomicrobia bacterium]|nr:PQQ-dependent sugar dehydrogenase [Verrucomicrobiota bacterium]MDA1067108.1 PQQ-dependent sugar dehydrogenase [Verrucomicrobiota bacterium]
MKIFYTKLLPLLLIAAVWVSVMVFDATREDLLPKIAPWEGSLLDGTDQDPLPFEAIPVHGEIPWDQPLAMVPVPGIEGEFYVILEREGAIWSLNATTGERTLMIKLGIPERLPYKVEGDRSTLGARFHPDFPKTPEFYVRSAVETAESGYNWLTRFMVDPSDPLKLDPGKEELVLEWEAIGHRGGDLDFGPDGYLYISSGDGSTPADPNNVGQKTDNLLGSILRIDVSGKNMGLNYRVPQDNPWVGVDGIRPEVWAYGLRNPWRMSFRPGTSEIWLGDNGDEHWELVQRVKGGENFGWSTFEGSHPFRPSNPLGGPNKNLTIPVVEQSHQVLRSVIGGVWYQGSQFPELKGHYIYGCYLTQKLWAFSMEGEQVVGLRRIADLGGQLVAFCEDPDRELLILAYDKGIFRLQRSPVRDLKPIPDKLSLTGLFESTANHKVASGFLPYEVNLPVYWDGAKAERFMAIPEEEILIQAIPAGLQKGDEAAIRSTAGLDRWRVPTQSLLMQTFSLENRRVETQVAIKDGGEWRYLSYRWNEKQTDADLVPEQGEEVELELKGGKQLWRFPSRSECIACHTQRGMFVLGLTLAQLNREFDYSAHGGGNMNQLDAIRNQYSFSNNRQISKVETLPIMPQVFDDSVPLEERARAYLHVNCAHCHRETGLGGRASFELLNWLANDRTGLINGRPLVGLPGIPANEARLVAPGDPDRSEIYRRMTSITVGKMPLLGNHNTIDESGAELIRQWIESIPPED